MNYPKPKEYVKEIKSRLGLHHAIKVAERCYNETKQIEWSKVPFNNKDASKSIYCTSKTITKLNKNQIHLYKTNNFWSNVLGILKKEKH